MIQFYFLSVLLNIVGGFALCEAAIPRRGASFEGVRDFLRGRTLRIVVGILVAVTGSFKLLSVIRGDIPIVGDFLPAFAGILVGGTLLMEAYRASSAQSRSEVGGEAPPSDAEGRDDVRPTADPSTLERALTENKVVIGTAGIIVGAAHFLFPTVLFL